MAVKIPQGQKLFFNKKEWGFISHKKKSLLVYSYDDKKAVGFTVNDMQLENIWKHTRNATELGICKETLKYIKQQEKEEQEKAQKLSNLVGSLKYGQQFLGGDGNLYYYMKHTTKKVYFYDGKDGEFSAGLGFVRELKNVFDKKRQPKLEPVRTMKEYNALTNKEKVETALQFVIDSNSESDTKFKVMDIGNIIEVYAHNHETDKHIKLIGLQVEVKVQYKFDGELQKPQTEVGFYPIYVGKASGYDPVCFTDSHAGPKYREIGYSNGFGDECENCGVLIPRENLIDLVDLKKYAGNTMT